LAYFFDRRSVFGLRTAFVIVLFSVIILSSGAKAQNSLDRNISFQARNEKLSTALTRLAANEKLNLSYNPGDKAFDMIITYSAVNKPIQTVLREILAISGHDFRLIGGQIVLYKTDAEPQQDDRDIEAVQTIRQTNQQAPGVFESPDVLFLRDTLIVRDTILRVDTIIIRDTVIIEKEVARTQKPERPAPLREDVFRFEADRNNGWSIMPFYAHMVSFNRLSGSPESRELLDRTKEAEAVSVINHSIGADIRFARNRWHITSGINYSRFTYRFKYNFETFEGGYFRNDTIDVYYTIPHADTIWHFVTDSTWIPLNSREYFYNRLNRHGFIEIPLTVGYNIYSDPNLRVWCNAGLSFGIVANRSGLAINASEEYTGIEFTNLNFRPLMVSYMLATGFRYKIGEWIDAGAEVFYRQHLHSVFMDYPLDKKIGAVGLKAGIVFYL